jgi:predicted dehydrogenase
MTVQELVKELETAILPEMPNSKGYKIGCIGSGFIMRDCQLVAYNNAGFKPYAIASRTKEKAQEVADVRGIKNVYTTWQEMIKDKNIDILDIAYPPHLQLEIVRQAVKQPHIKGILCQKPIAMSLEDTREIVDLCKEAGIKVAVNSNMRYDQSMRALKVALDKEYLGDPVLGTIEMRAIPHWQEFLKDYDHLEIFAMGIHHVDIFRYLFGDPEKITAVCRTDPRSRFDHVDGISQYTFQYDNGMMASSLDDVWAWPNEPCEKDIYIKWRVEGTTGMATGTIGWPLYPERSPSTFKMTSKHFPNKWIEPKWDEVWFPDAFVGTMAQLMCAIEQDEQPIISAEDNIKTIACVEACYKSIREERTVYLKEILEDMEGEG